MTRKVVITGAEGFLGWHMQVFLSTVEDLNVVCLDRTLFLTDTALEKSLEGASLVLHFAGVNRGSDDEIREGNPAIANRLVEALNQTGGSPILCYSSSIHENTDTVYGHSKKAAGDVLRSWAQAQGATFINFIIPHIFGEGGRPDYNSVISTFCHRVAAGQTPTIDHDGVIEPIHAQRLCKKIWTKAEKATAGCQDISIAGQKMKVSEMLARLTGMADSYRKNIFPDLREPFDLDLFNTYRSYLYPTHYPVFLEKHSDDRGWLVETVKERNGGQVFFSTTKPGITRGNHFHRHKVERFLVVSGKAEIRLRKIGEEDVQIFPVNGDEPSFVDIPTLHTHEITNTGDSELLTLFWVHEIFDPSNTDTYFVPVRNSA